jgi:hypothetical protein
MAVRHIAQRNAVCVHLTFPGGELNRLVPYIIEICQKQNSQVLRNLGMGPSFEIYTFDPLRLHCSRWHRRNESRHSLHVLLVQNGVVNRATIMGE